MGTDGLAYPTPQAIDANGTIRNTAVQNRNGVNPSVASSSGHVVLPADKQASFNSDPYAVIPVETERGGRGTVRMETASLNPNRKMYTVTLQNTYTGDNYELVLGDGMGLVADGLKIPALSGVVVVGGSWGTNSLVNLQKIFDSSPIDIHELHLTSQTLTMSTNGNPAGGGTPGVISGAAASELFFLQGAISVGECSLVNNSPNVDLIPLSFDITTESFRTDVRVRSDFRMQGNSRTGIVINLPAACALTVNFYINACETGYGMGMNFK